MGHDWNGGLSQGNSRLGVSIRTAYGLAVIGLPVVHRGTVRAMLPAGQLRDYPLQQHLTRESKMNPHGRSGRINVVSKNFQKALSDFDRDGWISRGEEFVLIRQPRMLLDFVGNWAQFDQLSFLLDIRSAVAQVRQDMDIAQAKPGKWVEQRRQELIALARLMDAPVTGQNRSGKGAVRLIPKGRVI